MQYCVKWSCQGHSTFDYIYTALQYCTAQPHKVVVHREPETWIPPGVPRILLSESDFHNPERRDDGMILSSVLLI